MINETVKHNKKGGNPLPYTGEDCLLCKLGRHRDCSLCPIAQPLLKGGVWVGGTAYRLIVGYFVLFVNRELADFWGFAISGAGRPARVEKFDFCEELGYG